MGDAVKMISSERVSKYLLGKELPLRSVKQGD